MFHRLIILVIFLVSFACFSESFSRDINPTQTWQRWIIEMRMPPKPSPKNVHRVLDRFTTSQWNMARVFILLHRLEGTCADLAFDSMAMDLVAADKVAGGSLWFGVSLLNKNHSHQSQHLSLLEEIDEAYEKHGEILCKDMYEKLGPNGALVGKFRSLFPHPKYGYRTQILWRSQDICDRSAEFWRGSSPVNQDLVKYVCKEADKHRQIWSQ